MDKRNKIAKSGYKWIKVDKKRYKWTKVDKSGQK